MAENENISSSRMPTPNPALKRLEPLVGTWNMTGRTLDAKTDNITGWNTFEWLPGGFFMSSRGEINFNGTFISSLEIIGYDAASDTFPSTVYSNLDGTPAAYAWNVQGNIVTHSDPTSKYTGTLSADGNTLSGGWRLNPGEKAQEGSNYDAVMTRQIDFIHFNGAAT